MMHRNIDPPFAQPVERADTHAHDGGQSLHHRYCGRAETPPSHLARYRRWRSCTRPDNVATAVAGGTSERGIPEQAIKLLPDLLSGGLVGAVHG